MRTHAALLIPACLLSACAGGVDTTPESTSEAVSYGYYGGGGYGYYPPSYRAGTSLNGPGLAGATVSGHAVVGVELGSVRLAGDLLSGVAVGGKGIAGLRPDGSHVEGADLQGASLSGLLADGSRRPLTVDVVFPALPPNSDVQLYGVSYDPGDGSRKSVCTDNAGNSLPAVAVPGTWDIRSGVAGGGAKSASNTLFTLSCVDAPIAKCVLLGYQPWAQAGGQSLDGYHQACVRMIRADYCGDGHSWTVEGRPISLYDALGLQTDTQRWFFEAEWQDTGSRCVSQERVIDLANALGVVSPCILSRLDLTCGQPAHFNTGTRLMNRFKSLSIRVGLLGL